MAIAEIAHVQFVGAPNGGTTGSIDTTGANLISLSRSRLHGVSATLSDSNGNTYTQRTEQDSGLYTAVCCFDCLNPTVGSGHTFTVGGTGAFGALFVESFSGLPSSLQVAQNGANQNNNAVSIATGAVTAVTGDLVVTGLMEDGTSNMSASAGYTVNEFTVFSAGNHFAGAIAYNIAAPGGSFNNTWTWANNSPGGSDSAAWIIRYTANLLTDGTLLTMGVG